jgi:hypothetical protein
MTPTNGSGLRVVKWVVQELHGRHQEAHSGQGPTVPEVKINNIAIYFSVLVNSIINRDQWTPEKTLTEHKDNDKTNNKSENLKFGSVGTNNQAAIDAGRSSSSDQSSRPILGAKDGTDDWIEYKSASVAAKELNLSTNVLKGRLKTTGGYIFRYKEQPYLPGEVWKDRVQGFEQDAVPGPRRTPQGAEATRGRPPGRSDQRQKPIFPPAHAYRSAHVSQAF